MKQNRGAGDVPATSFIEEFGEELKAKCLQNEPPFCEVACPFHLPVREMEEKWEKGRFNAVYRTYQTQVLFPAIVSELCPHPCEEACILKNRGGALALRELERATVRLAKRTRPNAYNLPEKPQKVAVVGAGLAGLGCALRLANKKYQVTIFEAGEVLGGRARDMMDASVCEAEIQNQFREEHPEILMGTAVRSLAELKGRFDAILIATGREGETFGLRPSDSGAFASDQEGFFLAGEVAGAEGPVVALSQGIRSALAVERFLKTGLMNEPSEIRDTRLLIDENRIPIQERITPEEPGQGYSEAEVASEARRCQKCSCNICRKECDLMRIQEKTPGRLYEEVYITVRPSTLANDGRWATRRIASCDQCGLCKEVCPQRIDMGKFLMQSHRGLKDTDAMPWAFHDFWLRDLQFSTEEAAAVIRRPETERCTYAYFPGCQMGGSDPSLLRRTADWFLARQPEGALWLDCCGAPAVWAAENEWQSEHAEKLRTMWKAVGEPTLVFACPSCRKMFDRYLPEIPAMFLEEALLAWGLPENGEIEGSGSADKDLFAVFDPCAGREYPQLAASVRQLADLLNVPHVDLAHAGENANCCSYGGQYSIAAPDYAKRVKMERAMESPLPYITSCINCRDTFASRGKENIHILDLVFGGRDLQRPNPTFTQRRENRVKIREHYRSEILHIKPEERKPMIHLNCSEELEAKLSQRYILRSDMEEVVAWCELHQVGVCCQDGTIIGHRKIGHMTYWAQYRVMDNNRYELVNGYAHRMNLEGE